MANLYEISRQLENFDFEVDEETGEMLNAPEWDALNMAYEEKVENIACYIKNLDSDIKALKEEEDSLKSRRRSKEKRILFLERLLVDNMDGAKYESSKCAISFRKSEQVLVSDVDSIPEAFMVKTVSAKPDKTAIKAAIKAGVGIPGCSLVENLNPQIK